MTSLAQTANNVIRSLSGQGQETKLPTPASSTLSSVVNAVANLDSEKFANLVLPKIDNAVKYATENPEKVASTLVGAAVVNAVRYAASTAPERAESAQLAAIKAEEAKIAAQIEKDRADQKALEQHRFLFPNEGQTKQA
ncbi:MAG: hypothetical protein KBC84_04345 [Proteobacteria bacterium]|nr:hypothetical protein [Pseudomonadota bacterium]